MLVSELSKNTHEAGFHLNPLNGIRIPARLFNVRKPMNLFGVEFHQML